MTFSRANEKAPSFRRGFSFLLSGGLDFQIEERLDSLTPRSSGVLCKLNEPEGVVIVDVVYIKPKLARQEGDDIGRKSHQRILWHTKTGKGLAVDARLSLRGVESGSRV